METVKQSKNKEGNNKAIFSSDVRSYANEPFFVQKAEEAKKKVSKMVLPADKK